MLVSWMCQTYLRPIGTHVDRRLSELGPMFSEARPTSLLQTDRQAESLNRPCIKVQQGGFIGEEFEPLSHQISGERALAALARGTKHDSPIAVSHHGRVKRDVVVAFGVQEGSRRMHQPQPNLVLPLQCQELTAVHADDPGIFLRLRREATAWWPAGRRAVSEVVLAPSLRFS